MRKLIVFNHITLDGYFTDANNDMSWAHGSRDAEGGANKDVEWGKFVEENAKSGGVLLFGRVTYQMMASFWPTPQGRKTDPVVAEHMNSLPKVVFSRTLDEATWEHTKLVKSNIAAEVRKLKAESGPQLVLMGSGQIVSQLTQERLIDEYQLVVVPLVLGKGRTMFEGIHDRLPMKLTKTRQFGNGNVVMWYAPSA